MTSQVWSRACVLVISCVAVSWSARAQATDATILWLAAGAHGAPCTAPDACAAALGLACVRESCVEAGGNSEACRSSEYPGKTRCDGGLACDDSICVPAGGNGEVCRSCESASSAFCSLDRCGTSLSCDSTSLTCEPAGGRNQPCRELELATSLPQCDAQRLCIMGTCVDAGGEGQPCAADLTCAKGLFCEQTGSGGYGLCSISPRGLVSYSMTAQATQCVASVETKFAALAASGGGYTTVSSFDAHEGERLRPEQAKVAGFDSDWNGSLNYSDWDRDHVQSILRLPGEKYTYLISHASNDDGPAGLMIANRSEALYLFPYDREPIYSHHPGGMSMFGNTVAVAVEHGGVGRVVPCSPPYTSATCRDVVDDERGWIDFWSYDEGNSTRPLAWRSQVSTDQLPGKGNRPSAVAYTRLPNGRGLMLVLGSRSAEGWLLAENEYGTFGLIQHFPDLYGTYSTWEKYQNIHFVTDCGGALFLVASGGSEDLLPRNRENFADLYRLDAVSRGNFKLTYVKGWQPSYSNERCEGRCGANPVVYGGYLTYVCATGLTSAPEGGGDNIGVAEISTVRYTALPEPGTICCEGFTPDGRCPSRAMVGHCD